MSDPEILFVVTIVTIVAAMCLFVVLLICIAWAFAKIANALSKTVNSGGRRSQIIQNPTVRPALEQICQLYNGRLLPGPMYELPRLTFDHQGTPVLVEVNYYYPGAALSLFHLSVRFVWPDGAFRMELYHDDMLARLKKRFGVRGIEVGDADFDRKFTISGNNATGVKNFLSPRVRELITLIRGPRYNDNIHLRIVSGHLWISKRSLPGEYGKILHLIEKSLVLYEAALQQPLAGIEFLGDLVIQPDLPICQVCGEAIGTTEIMCGQCRTPHHRECWHYFGGCSIYGCRGREFEPYAIVPAHKK